MAHIQIPRYDVYRTVTKSDTVDVAQVNDRYPDALQCGEAGIVRVINTDNFDIQFTVAAGEILPITFKRVMSTTTAGTLFVAMWSN
jgi:hypothetical protein